MHPLPIAPWEVEAVLAGPEISFPTGLRPDLFEIASTAVEDARTMLSADYGPLIVCRTRFVGSTRQRRAH